MIILRTQDLDHLLIPFREEWKHGDHGKEGEDSSESVSREAVYVDHCQSQIFLAHFANFDVVYYDFAGQARTKIS